ncbi:MAG: dTMP kinase [Roseibacillus sp.]|nr:dTMP kinase [Roseibacillus sp.]
MNLPANYPGLLIVLEGIDGTGKSTQTRLLAEALREQGFNVTHSREPTDGIYGRKLRESATTGRLSAEEELDLFHKDRREHVERLILPALKAGDIVVLDRYYFSTMAYQGIRGFDPQEIRRTNEEFAPRPDLLLLLELSLDTAMARIGVRDGRGNQFERRESLQLCREIFHSVKDDFVHIIDADQSVEQAQKAIISTVRPALASLRARKAQ